MGAGASAGAGTSGEAPGNADDAGPVGARGDGLSAGPGSSDGGGSRRDAAIGVVADGLVPGGAAQPCAFTFCDSFETVGDGARPDPALWKGNATITVDSVRAYRGKKAMHIPPLTGAGSALLSPLKVFPPPSKKHFGRLFLWIDKAPPFGQGFLHWSVVTALSKSTTGVPQQHHFGGEAGARQPSTHLQYTGYSPAGYFAGKSVKTELSLRQWHCLEWSFDTNESKATFWWNGVEQTDLGLKVPATQPQFQFSDFSNVLIGWREFHGLAAPWEVWIDEVAIGNERITCDR